MLKTVEIKNFQSHKDTTLEFHKGMNVITGSSDQGKSSIIRALLLAITNKPSGGSYKSWDAGAKDEVSVGLEFDDFWTIRTRNKEQNKYTSENGEFVALRQDIPEEIRSKIDIDDHNYQTQFQKYFLLQDSPGDRAKKINDLVGLGIIDEIIKKLNARLSAAKQDLKTNEQYHSETKNKLDEMKHLDAVAVLISRASKDIEALDKLRLSAEAASGLVLRLRKMNIEKEKYKTLIESEKEVLGVKKILEESNILVDSANTIEGFVEDWKSLESQRLLTTTILKAEPTIKRVKELLVDHENKIRMVNSLQKLRNNLDEIDAHKNNLLIKIEKDADSYCKLLQKHKKCPTCYGVITEKTIESIRKEINEPHYYQRISKIG